MQFAALAFIVPMILLACAHCSAEQATPPVPEFEFDVWGHPPSQQVYALTRDKAGQALLFSIRETALTPAEIAARAGESESKVTAILEQLEEFGIVRKTGDRWLSMIPMYTESDFREAEKVSLKYAETEAAILRRALPRLKELYGRTDLARQFAWEKVSLIIAGAMLGDFCVMDRVAFQPANYNEDLQPPLRSKDGDRWGYTGFQKVATRFPSRRWKFYQNVLSLHYGGTTRFGYLQPAENRKSPPRNPEGWVNRAGGMILFALAEKPMSLPELQAATGLPSATVEQTLGELAGFDPPAVTRQGERYANGIPILTERDLNLLLPECDRIAEEIHQRVSVPHLAALKQRAKELGQRWPLPSDTYVRDKALQTLIEEGLLAPVPDPPVSWNFSVWGWKGFMAQHEQVTRKPKPDPFLATPVSEAEKASLEEFAALKQKILAGEKFSDLSTPARALLTRVSAYVHSDVAAVKAVQITSTRFTEEDFAKQKSWMEYMRGLRVWRLPPPPASPKDGDAAPVFTIVDDMGYKNVHVFFYYRGGWRVLFNGPDYGFWKEPVESTVKSRLAQLARN